MTVMTGHHSNQWSFSGDNYPELAKLLEQLDSAHQNPQPNMDNLRPVKYLSEASGNAIISEMRQTSISPAALLHINLLLDEVMSSLLEAAQSLNPKELRSTGVPAVFSSGGTGAESTGVRSFARECVAEAELEMRSWHELNPGQKGGFGPGGKGRGLTASKESSNARFPTEEALDLLRLRCTDLSSMSPSLPNYTDLEDAVLTAWKAAGGDTSEHTIEPTVCWVNGLIEHICERILAQLGRVIERDSSVSVASPQDLYIALAEDECIYGWFSRLKVKASLQAAMAAQKSGKRSVQRDPTTGRASPAGPRLASHGDYGSRNKKNSSVADVSRTSIDSSRVANVTRKPSSMSKRFGTHHDRKDSALSVSTRSLRGNGSTDVPEEPLARSRSPQEDEDDFDALVRSGQTMKVSLTPSRLKTFEGVQKRGPEALAQKSRQPVPQIPRQHIQPTVSANRPAPERPSTDSHSRKLTARGAGVEELLDDDKGQGRNQSLRELLDSEPADYASQPTAARTVPAVILGSAPPSSHTSPDPSSQEIVSGQKSSNRDPLASRRNRDQDDAFPRRKARTEAQDLADFLNNTPPPPSRSEPVEKAVSQKSGKGFKGFMSKVTGGNKKKEEESRIARENAAWDIPTATPISSIRKHHRSATSLATSNGAPSSFRQVADEDHPPVPRTLRKRSDGSERRDFTASGVGAAAGAAAAATAGAAAIHVTREKSESSETVQPQSTSRSSPQSQNGVTSTVETGRQTGRAVTPPKSVQPATVDPARVAVAPTVAPSAPVPAEAISPAAPVVASPPRNESLQAKVEHFQVNRSPSSSPSRRKPAPIVESSTPDTTATPRSTGISPGNSSLTAGSTTDSFATALDEHGHEDTDGEPVESRGVDTAAAVPSAQTEDSATLVESEKSPKEKSVKSADSDAAEPAKSLEPTQLPAPSIPLAQLVPLRGLLRHATSATECRLLLSAMLSHLGVPQHSQIDEIEPGPEEKVAAWLLSGSCGPPVDWDHLSTLKGDTTPKVSPSIISDTAAKSKQSEEELLSETASSTSAPTTPDGERASVAVATSGTRSSSGRL